MPRRKSESPATIRAAVQARVKELDLTAYAIAKRTEGAVSDDTLRRYLAGTHDIASQKADALLRVLDLEIVGAE